MTGLARAACTMAFALAGMTAAGPSVARTVEYLDDMSAIRAAAEDQGISGDLSEPPGPGAASIVLEGATAADHRVIVASIFCQAYKIDNPVSTLLERLVARANGDQAGPGIATDRPSIALRVLSGSTVLRCMSKTDLEATCRNRVRIAAEVHVTRPDGSVATTPIVAQIERDGRVGGFCGNIARYTGIVSREAGIELIRQARAASGG